MLERIRGRILAREPAAAVVEAGGLGYRVLMPLATAEALPAPGGEATLLLHLVVREDEWRLYGFVREDDRAVFRRLLRIPGIGPGLALGLLSGLSAAELRAAVIHGDLKTLSRVKGVGRKTAERVVLELREEWCLGADGGAPAAPAGPAGPAGDAARALESLGLDPLEARRRVERLLAEGAPADPGELVRRALRL